MIDNDFEKLSRAHQARMLPRTESKVPGYVRDLRSQVDDEYFASVFGAAGKARRQRIVEDVQKSVESQDAAWLHDRMKTCAADEGFDEAPVCNKCGMPARYHKSDSFLECFQSDIAQLTGGRV